MVNYKNTYDAMQLSQKNQFMIRVDLSKANKEQIVHKYFTTTNIYALVCFFVNYINLLVVKSQLSVANFSLTPSYFIGSYFNNF
jgi:hypothetical protein